MIHKSRVWDGWDLMPRDVGDTLMDLLALGWRVQIKPHLVPLASPEHYPYRDGADGIGWVADGFAYGSKRDDVSRDDRWRTSGVGPTPESALTHLLRLLGSIDPAVEDYRLHRPR